MKKIKFKIEYVPLSDAQIERHKDFDGLMTAFAAHPKPSFKERLKAKLFGNKFFVYLGGIITGVIVTSVMWWGVNHYQASNQIVQKESAQHQNELAPSTEEKENSQIQLQQAERGIIDEKNGSAITSAGTKEESKQEISDTQKEMQSNAAANSLSNSAAKKSEKKSAQNSKKKTSNANVKVIVSGGIAQSSDLKNEKSVSEKSKKDKEAKDDLSKQNSGIAIRSDSLGNSNQNVSMNDSSNGNGASLLLTDKNFEADTLTKKGEDIGATVEEPASSLPDDTTKKKFQIDLPKIDLAEEWSITKNAVSKFSDSLGNKTSGLVTKIFGSDSTKKAAAAAAALATEPGASSETTPTDDTFKHRFAQVSFVTPLGSDGNNAKDYEHNLSLNILQGYNGALNGVEFGGLANVEKGYVKGAQFGGLVNFAFGDVNGAQFAGLVNNGKNVEGFQAAGVVNTATGTLNGVQAGGVVNTVIDTMNGLQLGGALNLSLSNKWSAVSWQIAGAANVSLGKSTGGQIAGAFNVANEHNGIQIGTINFSKKISGFQLGIINIADSIDGESLGLINVYRNGIHNVDVFGSEVLFINAGLKLGSPHVYTMFAFGIRPYSDLTRMGLGIGIGGHIPLNHGFVNIDGVCWSIHNGDLSDWNNVNLWNQIRFMYGYQITKGISIYARPTLNAQVYDLSYPSVAPYTIYQSTGSPTRVDGWIGGVIGIQFF